MEAQDARIATREFQFSPGGTTVTGYRVPISELMMNKNKTQAKRSAGWLGRRQREKLGAQRERDMPASVAEVRRPALAPLDPNLAWTEQLAKELGS